DRASMQSIPQLITSVQTTGTIIRPSIIIQDVDACPPALDRAIYRIVQEALTNAMKHAPNSPVTVEVAVSAAAGAKISVANPVPGKRDIPPRPQYAPDSAGGLDPGTTARSPRPATDLTSTGSGSGLVGIRERTELFGGTAALGVRAEEFRVDVEFPPFASGACFEGTPSPAPTVSSTSGSVTIMSPTTAIRVMVVDDDPMVITGIKGILRAAEDIDVVGSAMSGEEAIEKAALHYPEVVLMDIRMP